MKFYPSPRSLLPGAFSLLLLALGCGSKPFATDEGDIAARRPAGAPQQATPQARVVVVEDEARLRGSQAVLGGAVENLSPDELTGLRLELELRARDDSRTERREVKIEPARLAPGERGRYALSVSREWGSARIVRLTGAAGGEVAFRSERGAPRPPEVAPASRPRGSQTPPTRPRPKGEEFLNTPETAIPVN